MFSFHQHLKGFLFGLFIGLIGLPILASITLLPIQWLILLAIVGSTFLTISIRAVIRLSWFGTIAALLIWVMIFGGIAKYTQIPNYLESIQVESPAINLMIWMLVQALVLIFIPDKYLLNKTNLKQDEFT